MTTDRRLDPELAAALAQVPRGPNGVFDFSDIPAARLAVRAFAEQIAAAAPWDPSIVIEDHVARPEDGRAGDASEVPLHILRSARGDAQPHAAAPALLWFHGGGQVLGFAAQDDSYLSPLAAAVGCVVVSVEYRLAPEVPAPGAAEDGVTAYAWVHRHAAELGIDPSRIALAGASGGGGIAAAVALMIRDRGLPKPLFQALNYPMLDDRHETPSSHEMTDIGIFDRRSSLLAWDAVLGDRVGADDLTPYAAPARAADLTGVAPAFIAVGDHDLFRDEDLAYAQLLVASGVPVELHLYAGAYHAFDLFAPASAVATSFIGTWYSYLRRHFGADVTEGPFAHHGPRAAATAGESDRAPRDATSLRSVRDS